MIAFSEMKLGKLLCISYKSCILRNIFFDKQSTILDLNMFLLLLIGSNVL